MQSFRELKVWQKAKQLTVEIYELTDEFPKDEKFTITGQIRRSSLSICSNIAEGYRKSNKDFLRFLDIAQGSLEETKNHLLISIDLKYGSLDRINALLESCDVIGKMLCGLSKSLKQKPKL